MCMEAEEQLAILLTTSIFFLKIWCTRSYIITNDTDCPHYHMDIDVALTHSFLKPILLIALYKKKKKYFKIFSMVTLV